MMKGNVISIRLHDRFIEAEFETPNGIGDNITSYEYDDDSAIALAVDLLARLVIMEEASADGFRVNPANGMEVSHG